jgi:hypothetical protein
VVCEILRRQEKKHGKAVQEYKFRQTDLQKKQTVYDDGRRHVEKQIEKHAYNKICVHQYFLFSTLLTSIDEKKDNVNVILSAVSNIS